MSNFLYDDRNNELSHRDALAAAQAEHERVREAAIRVYELHELQVEHRRIVEAERREEQRLQAEAKIAAEEKRLQELKAKTIPKPPPQPEPKAEEPKPTPTIKPTPAISTNSSTPPREALRAEVSTTPPSEFKKPVPTPEPQTNGNGSLANQGKPATLNPFASIPAQSQSTTQSNPFAKPNGLTATPSAGSPAVSTPPVQTQAPTIPTKPKAVDRYTQIHQELKKLRKELQAQSKVAGSPMKGKLGAFRREIRVSIGQLTGGKGKNAQPVSLLSLPVMAHLTFIDQQNYCDSKRGVGRTSTQSSYRCPPLHCGKERRS